MYCCSMGGDLFPMGNESLEAMLTISRIILLILFLRFPVLLPDPLQLHSPLHPGPWSVQLPKSLENSAGSSAGFLPEVEHPAPSVFARS